MNSNPPSPAVYTIILLRHGESIGNADGFIQGQADFPLTELGRQQAQVLAARWLEEGVTFDHVISSTLIRARETAEIITSALNIPVEYDPIWKERSFGQLEGMRDEDVELTDPGVDFWHPYHTIGKTGESMVDLYIRANQAVQNLLRRPIGRYLVVSHGAILNMVLFSILGLSPQGRIHSPGFRFQNTSFATLTYIPDQRVWMVLGLNDHAHWIEEKAQET